MPKRVWTLSRVISFVGIPSIFIVPLFTSYKRMSRFTSVVLPDPDGPTMAQLVRSGMLSDTSSITVRSP